jgi:PPOX class probable F420-dependent enzyme
MGKLDALDDPLADELLAARLIANLATLNRDGSVHLVPLWFAWDGEAILLPTNHATRKIRNLESDDRATVMIDDSRVGFDVRGIMLRGRAALIRAPSSLDLNRAIHERYVTANGLALAPVREYLDTDDVTIRLTPEEARSWDARGTTRDQALRESGEYLPLPMPYEPVVEDSA